VRTNICGDKVDPQVGQTISGRDPFDKKNSELAPLRGVASQPEIRSHAGSKARSLWMHLRHG
jgi:hypothetical protein